MRPLLAFALIIALHGVLCAPPTVISTTVEYASGSLGGNDVRLAEYEATFDQDLRWLEVTDCPGTPCTPDPLQCACDYTSKNMSVCGVSPGPGCNCNQTFCDLNIVDDWIPLEIGVPVRAQIPRPSSAQQFRLFLPPTARCQALHIRLAQYSGDTDLFVTNDLTNPPYGGPFLAAETNALLGYVPGDPSGYGGFPWFSFRTRGDHIVMCPNEHWNADPALDNYQPGTYYIQVQTYAYPGDFVISAELLPIAPQWTLSDALANNWPVPVPCSETLQQYPNHVCLGEDDFVESRDWASYEPEMVYRFVKQMEGPCPHLYSMSGQDAPYAYWRAYGRVNGIDSNFTFVNPFEPGSIPRGQLVDKEGLIVFDDFVRGYLTFSVCPTEGNRSTVFFLTRRTLSAANLPPEDWFRFFFTVNPARFRATPISDLGPFLEQSFITVEGIDFKTRDGSEIPDVTDTNGIIFPCTFDGGGQCPNFYLTMTAAAAESTPIYPLPLLARKQILPGPNFPEPSFLANATRLPNVIRATLLIGLEFSTGFLGGRWNAVPAEHVENLMLRFPNGRFVNQDMEAAFINSTTLSVGTPVCDQEAYNQIVNGITAAEELFSGSYTSVTLAQAEIDYLSWRPAYLGCNSLTQSLLGSFTNSFVINERNCLADRPGAQNLDDPCCSPLSDWAGVCCLPTQTTTKVSVFTPPESANSLKSTCGAGSDCVSTYLEDYSRAIAAVCRPPLQELFFKERYAFWVECSDLAFGQYLRGRPCSTDADCRSIGSFNTTTGYCEFIDIYTPWSVDPEQPKYGICVNAYSDVLDSFLQCFIDRGGLQAVLVLSSYNITTDDPIQQRQQLKQVAALQSADCLASHVSAIPPTDPNPSDHRWVGQSHWIWDIGNAQFICDSSRSPKMFHGSPGYLSFFEAPYSCERVFFQNDGGSIQYPVPQFSSQSDCQSARICNVIPPVSTYGMDDASLSAACSGPSRCVVCRPDNTHCVELPASLTAGGCPAEVCWNVDGSMSLPPCTERCTVPCRDTNNNNNFIPCTTSNECTNAGRCTDEGVWRDWNTTALGACLWEADPYHRDSCLWMPASPGRLGFLDLPIGCVQRDLDGNAAECEDVIGGHWYPGDATNRTECEAYGCGCVKPASGLLDLSQLINVVDTVESSPEDCAACGQTCQPFFSWIGGQWVVGTLHAVQNVTPTVLTPFVWTNNTFDLMKLSEKLESIILSLYGQQIKSSAQCRFNKIAPSIQAVALSCSANPDLSQLSSIVSERPSGIGRPCGGAALVLSAPPNTIHWQEDSLSPTGFCPDVQIYNVPADSFGGVAPSQQLSTYFTKKRRGARGRTLEFTNRKRALIGQVLGNGIRIEANGSANFVATNVRLCLNAGVVTATLNKKFDRYPVYDIAELQGDLLVPLRVDVTNDATLGQCATIPQITPSTFVPVIRLNGTFEDQEPPSLTTGEKTILLLACAAYFLTACYAVYHVVIIIMAATLIPFYLLPPFWMATMLTLTNAIRGVYFALIGSETIANSNVADIILFELPTFMWFTATTLVVLLWISIGSARRQKEIGPLFRILFLVSNGVMYLLFIIFVVLFSVLDDKKKTDEFCGDRLPVTYDRSQRKNLFIAYQCFLAVVALALSLAFLFGGIKLIKMLRSSKKNPNAPLSQDEIKLLMLAVVCGLSFFAHAVFVFVLAIVQPGIAYLVVILVALECIPSCYLLWNLPTRTRQGSGTSSTSGGGSNTA